MDSVNNMLWNYTVPNPCGHGSQPWMCLFLRISSTKIQEEKERDEKYERQYKRNRQAIYEVYHPMKRSLRTEKNARGDIIKEIVQDNFPDLKTHPNLRVKKVLKY